jgi:predicted type IV restriction endonuclease
LAATVFRGPGPHVGEAYGRRPLIDGAKAAKKSEADISGLMFMMLEEVFGYDKTSEVSAEYRIRAQFADYAIKLSGKPVVLIEVKGPTVRLTQNHLLQVSAYAMQLGIEWVILTNGLVWQLFHISRTTPLEEDPVFECDLSEGAKQETVEKLCALTREYVIRGEPRKIYEKVQAVRPQNLLRCLYSEPVLREVRRSLKASTGYKADIDELQELIDRHLLRPELVGKVKPPRKPRVRVPRPKQVTAPSEPTPAQ